MPKSAFPPTPSAPAARAARLERLALPSPVPLARLVEKTIPLGATVEDAEARGRLAVLSRIAVGANLTDIEDEAERCAAWIVDRAAREGTAGEVFNQMLDQLARDKVRLQ